MVSDEHDALVSPAEAARLLNLSRVTIYRRIAAGTLPALKLGPNPQSHLRIPVRLLAEQLHLPDTKEHDDG